MAEEDTGAEAQTSTDGTTQTDATEQEATGQERYASDGAENPAGDAGDGSADDAGKAGDEGETTEGEPEPLKIALPEGVPDEHREAADKFAGVVGEFLKGKPDATPADIAQLAVDHQLAEVRKATEDFSAEVERWGDEVRNDPVLGGDNFGTTQSHVHQAMEAYGSPELEHLLDSTGLGNNKAVIEAFAKIGRDIAGAGVEPSKGSTQAFDPIKARYSA